MTGEPVTVRWSMRQSQLEVHTGWLQDRYQRQRKHRLSHPVLLGLYELLKDMHGICYNEKDLLTHDVLEVLHKLYVLYMSVRCKIKVERPSDKRYNFRGK